MPENKPKPRAYFLIGVGCSGRTRLRKHLIKFHGRFNFIVLSEDDRYLAYAKRNQISYSMAKAEIRDKVVADLHKEAERAYTQGNYVIWDVDWFLTEQSRRQYLAKVPKTYEIIGFHCETPKNRLERNKLRQDFVYSDTDLEDQSALWEPPHIDEGYDHLVMKKM